MRITTYIKLLLVLLLIPIITWTNATETAAQSAFTDFGPNDFGYESVIVLADQEIIKGFQDGSFRPKQKLNRADAAVLFQRALKLKPPTQATSFKDVRKGLYYTEAAAATKAAGIFKGNANGTFGPNDLLTREQMASVIVRALQLKPIPNATVKINDQNKISASHRTDVITLYQNEVTKGKSGNNFDPKAVVTRAEFSVFLFRSIELNDVEEPQKPEEPEEVEENQPAPGAGGAPGGGGGAPVNSIPSISSAHLTTKNLSKKITGTITSSDSETTISFDLSKESDTETLQSGKITVSEAGTMTLTSKLGTETETLKKGENNLSFAEQIADLGIDFKLIRGMINGDSFTVTGTYEANNGNSIDVTIVVKMK